MIKVTIMYPNGDGLWFNVDYYVTSHMPLVQELMGDALKGMEIDAGLYGEEPGSPPPYFAIGHLLFDSIEAFQTALAPHTARLEADFPNYSNSIPMVQISDVRL